SRRQLLRSGVLELAVLVTPGKAFSVQARNLIFNSFLAAIPEDDLIQFLSQDWMEMAQVSAGRNVYRVSRLMEFLEKYLPVNDSSARERLHGILMPVLITWEIIAAAKILDTDDVWSVSEKVNEAVTQVALKHKMSLSMTASAADDQKIDITPGQDGMAVRLNPHNAGEWISAIYTLWPYSTSRSEVRSLSAEGKLFNLVEGDASIPLAIRYLDLFFQLAEEKVAVENQTGNRDFEFDIPRKGSRVSYTPPGADPVLLLATDFRFPGGGQDLIVMESDYPIWFEFQKGTGVLEAVYIAADKDGHDYLKLEILRKKRNRSELEPFNVLPLLGDFKMQGPLIVEALLKQIPAGTKNELVLRASVVESERIGFYKRSEVHLERSPNTLQDSTRRSRSEVRASVVSDKVKIVLDAAASPSQRENALFALEKLHAEKKVLPEDRPEFWRALIYAASLPLDASGGWKLYRAASSIFRSRVSAETGNNMDLRESEFRQTVANVNVYTQNTESSIVLDAPGENEESAAVRIGTEILRGHSPQEFAANLMRSSWIRKSGLRIKAKDEQNLAIVLEDRLAGWMGALQSAGLWHGPKILDEIVPYKNARLLNRVLAVGLALGISRSEVRSQEQETRRYAFLDAMHGERVSQAIERRIAAGQTPKILLIETGQGAMAYDLLKKHDPQLTGRIQLYTINTERAMYTGYNPPLFKDAQGLADAVGDGLSLEEAARFAEKIKATHRVLNIEDTAAFPEFDERFDMVLLQAAGMDIREDIVTTLNQMRRALVVGGEYFADLRMVFKVIDEQGELKDLAVFFRTLSDEFEFYWPRLRGRETKDTYPLLNVTRKSEGDFSIPLVSIGDWKYRFKPRMPFTITAELVDPYSDEETMDLRRSLFGAWLTTRRSITGDWPQDFRNLLLFLASDEPLDYDEWVSGNILTFDSKAGEQTEKVRLLITYELETLMRQLILEIGRGDLDFNRLTHLLVAEARAVRDEAAQPEAQLDGARIELIQQIFPESFLREIERVTTYERSRVIKNVPPQRSEVRSGSSSLTTRPSLPPAAADKPARAEVRLDIPEELVDSMDRFFVSFEDIKNAGRFTITVYDELKNVHEFVLSLSSEGIISIKAEGIEYAEMLKDFMVGVDEETARKNLELLAKTRRLLELLPNAKFQTGENEPLTGIALERKRALLIHDTRSQISILQGGYLRVTRGTEDAQKGIWIQRAITEDRLPPFKVDYAVKKDGNSSAERAERYEKLINFYGKQEIRDGMNADGTLFVPTPLRIIPSIFSEIQRVLGQPLRDRNYLSLGSGLLHDSLYAAAVEGMRVTAVERDASLSARAKIILGAAQQQSLVADPRVRFFPGADAFDRAWADLDVVYFFYTQSGKDRDAYRANFQRRLLEKFSEMKPGSVLAMLFTGAQLMDEQAVYPELEPFFRDQVEISPERTGLYLRIYQKSKEMDERSEVRSFEDAILPQFIQHFENKLALLRRYEGSLRVSGGSASDEDAGEVWLFLLKMRDQLSGYEALEMVPPVRQIKDPWKQRFLEILLALEYTEETDEPGRRLLGLKSMDQGLRVLVRMVDFMSEYVSRDAPREGDDIYKSGFVLPLDRRPLYALGSLAREIAFKFSNEAVEEGAAQALRNIKFRFDVLAMGSEKGMPVSDYGPFHDLEVMRQVLSYIAFGEVLTEADFVRRVDEKKPEVRYYFDRAMDVTTALLEIQRDSFGEVKIEAIDVLDLLPDASIDYRVNPRLDEILLSRLVKIITGKVDFQSVRSEVRSGEALNQSFANSRSELTSEDLLTPERWSLV
ncbi:MAG: hypothetical protein KBC91_05095, partial [Candidatus Omnitrophica bacterium]|nr:hypothetical protein [Candidatus Omnitrophota bacterium]